MKLAVNGGVPLIKEQIKERWENIIDSDVEKVSYYIKHNDISVIDGGVLKEFEEKFARFIGTRYAVAYCNGTAALHAASFACGAGKSTNFILSEYSYHGTVNSLLENNSKAILINYDPKTLDICLDNIGDYINNKTKGIIVTHCWGNPVNINKLKEVKEKYGIKIISDASHAHGAKWEGKAIGSLDCEDIACFSLGKNKLISVGELGVAVTNNPELYDALLFMGHPNRVPNALITSKYKKYVNGVGNKYRPHPLSMVLAIEQLKRYPKKMRKNIRTNRYLIDRISKIDGFIPIESYEGAERVYWKLQIRADMNYWKEVDFNKLVEALKKEGLTLEQHHNYNIKEHLKLWDFDRYKGMVENKSDLCSPDNIIVLPGYVDISNHDKSMIVETFKKVSKNKEELL